MYFWVTKQFARSLLEIQMRQYGCLDRLKVVHRKFWHHHRLIAVNVWPCPKPLHNGLLGSWMLKGGQMAANAVEVVEWRHSCHIGREHVRSRRQWSSSNRHWSSLKSQRSFSCCPNITPWSPFKGESTMDADRWPSGCTCGRLDAINIPEYCLFSGSKGVKWSLEELQRNVMFLVQTTVECPYNFQVVQHWLKDRSFMLREGTLRISDVIIFTNVWRMVVE